MAEPGRDAGGGRAATDHGVGVPLGGSVRVNNPLPRPVMRNSGPYLVFADSILEISILVWIEAGRLLITRKNTAQSRPKTAVVKTYPIPTSGFASLDSPGRRNRHLESPPSRPPPHPDVVKTFAFNPLQNNGAASPKPPNPRRRANDPKSVRGAALIKPCGRRQIIPALTPGFDVSTSRA
jgi:hypothetical protein